MDWLEYRQKAKSWLNRYKFVVLILCIGILLMVQPVKKETDHHAAEATVPDHQPDITEQLSDILAQIKGVGKVRIMLTEAAAQRKSDDWKLFGRNQKFCGVFREL